MARRMVRIIKDVLDIGTGPSARAITRGHLMVTGMLSPARGLPPMIRDLADLASMVDRRDRSNDEWRCAIGGAALALQAAHNKLSKRGPVMVRMWDPTGVIMAVFGPDDGDPE
jgi:hypothetical protein